MKDYKTIAKKYVKKQGKRAYKAAKARYVTKGGPNVANIYKDVMMLKALVNVEKKRSDNTSTGAIGFGQTAGVGVTGAFSQQINPTIAQGLTGATRTGNSVKLVSGCLDMYFNQSVNTINQVKIRWILVCRPDSSLIIASSSALTNVYEINPFSAVIDYHSNRDPEFFSQYKMIKTGTVTLQQDQLAGGIAYAQVKIPMKFNHHLKYNTDASTTSVKNQFYLFATCDQGDAVALSGAQIQYNMRWYFTDN